MSLGGRGGVAPGLGSWPFSKAQTRGTAERGQWGLSWALLPQAPYTSRHMRHKGQNCFPGLLETQ